MHVEVTRSDPGAVGADLVAAAAGARALELGAPERAVADADPVAMVYTAAAPLAVVALEPGVDGLRTAAARAVRACRGGGTVAWALDDVAALAVEEQVRALAEGAVIGGYDARRWRSGEPPRGVERFVICGCDETLGPVADRAALRRPLDERRPRARRRAGERGLPGGSRGARRGAPAAARRDHRRPPRPGSARSPPSAAAARSARC